MKKILIATAVAAAFGMANATDTLLGFLLNYLYGFVFTWLPLLMIMILVNRMVVRPIDRGSMAYLLASPTSRLSLALTFALAHPERVQSLILNGANLEPGGVKLSTQLPIVLGYGCCRLLSPFSHKARQNGALLGLMVNHPHIPPQALAALTMPALVIVGERDMIRDRHSQLIARSLPNAQFVRIPGGDHFCAAKCPEAFNRALLSFLQNLPA